MSRKRRMHGEEFKLQVLTEADAGVPLAELCRRYELSSSMIYRWKRQLNSCPQNPFLGRGSRNTDKAKIKEMERLIGR